MKLIINTLLLITPCFLIAQKTDLSLTQPLESHTKKASFNHKVLNGSEAKESIKDQLKFTINEDLKLLHKIKSPHGIHYTYIQTYLGHEIRNAHFKVNTDKTGNVTSFFYTKANPEDFQSIKINKTQLESIDLPSPIRVNSKDLIWVKTDDNYELVMNVKFTDNEGGYFEQLFNRNNELIEEFDLLNHFHDADTTAKALVFSPNPLTSAETTYGGKYIDNNDATSPELDAERDTVDIKITYNNGAFFLENDYIKIVEISAPNVPPVESTTPEFYYDRSQSGFEDVNVIHHITRQQEFIRSLGFTNIVNYQIYADCHGFNGADNSAFNSGTNPPSIIFGEGGVDDAEDADVIIHEYTHAIMESASPGTNFGTERNAMDEAFGDYMAVSYSNLYNNHHSDYVFKWDGHNEYWNGRLSISNKMYPDDLQYHLYGDAPLWSSALTRIERNIGREVTTNLALEAAYSFTSNMTMAQAAELFITTDSLINNGDNYGVVCWTFKDKGMVDNCTVGRPSGMLSTQNIEEAHFVQLLNSHNYANGTANLLIKCNDTFSVKIYDLTGRLIISKQNQVNEMEITPNQIKDSAFILEVTSNQGSKKFKVIR